MHRPTACKLDSVLCRNFLMHHAPPYRLQEHWRVASQNLRHAPIYRLQDGVLRRAEPRGSTWTVF
jgi:hypothetical protein